MILCHSFTEESEIDGYKFVGLINAPVRWGKWVTEKGIKSPSVKRTKDRQEFYYRDRQGNEAVRVIRSGRNFYQQHWLDEWRNGVPDAYRQVIPVYRFQEVRKAIASGQKIFWVEGESTADALWKIGIPATTTIGGCKGYKKYGDYSGDLSGASIILCPDRDEEGLKYMAEVAADWPNHQWCKVLPESPLWKYIPKSGGIDAVDWIAEGATKDDILNAVQEQHPQESAPVTKKGFAETMDEVLEATSNAKTDAERQWGIAKYASDNKLHRLGIGGKMLAHMAEQHQAHNTELVIKDAYDIAGSDDINEFIIAGLLPKGSVVLLGAYGGTGKTTFCYSMATAIASEHIEWSGYPTVHGKVLVIQADEPERDMARKLAVQRFRSKCEPGRVGVLSEWTFAQWDKTEELILENNYSLVIIDSFTATNPGLEMTRSSAGQCLYKLRNLANDHGISFIVVHHLSKDGSFRDSTTLVDNVSETWKISRPAKDSGYEKGTILMEIGKSRSGIQGNYLLMQNARDYGWSFLGEANHPDEVGVEPFYVTLLKSMTDGENRSYRYRAADVAQLFGIDYEKADLTLQKLWRMGQLKNEWVAIANINGSSDGYFEYWLPQVQEVAA